MLLVDTLPTLAADLRELLISDGRPELAAQIPGLKILDRCHCDENFCASFYTQPKPKGSYGPDLECLELEPAEGMLILDVVSGVIAHVEVLFNDGLRDRKKQILRCAQDDN